MKGGKEEEEKEEEEEDEKEEEEEDKEEEEEMTLRGAGEVDLGGVGEGMGVEYNQLHCMHV